MSRKVKVGDKLVVKKDLDRSFVICLGDVLTVTYIDVEGEAFKVNTPNGDNIYLCNDRVGEFLAFADEVKEQTYRERLAEEIYIAAFTSENRIFQHDAFKAADAFIEERDRQRKAAIQKEAESET